MTPNILLIADFGTFGGTRTYFDKLIELYENLGYTIFLAIEPQLVQDNDFSKFLNRIILLPEQQYVNPTGIIQKVFNIIHYLWIQFAVFFIVWLEVRRKKIDLVVVSTGCYDGYLSIFALSIPCLYINHTTPQKSNRDRFFKIFLKKYLNSHKKIITNSKHMRDAIIEIWGSEIVSQYILIINYGLKQFKKYNLIKDEKDHLNSKNIILTIGNVVWYKNPEMWIQVAQYFKDEPLLSKYKWVWAGAGELLEHCQSIIKKKEIHNAVFTGYYINIQELYERAIIYFQPSILESFGLSVVDAMKMSLPCVVTRVGGLPELVIDGETGFIVNDGDISGAVEKISWLLKYQEEREKMGKSGFFRYEKYFTEEIWINNMKKLHLEIFSQKSGDDISSSDR